MSRRSRINGDARAILSGQSRAPHQFTRQELKAAESAIYQMLCAEYPDMKDEQREQLAREGAQHSLSLARQEQATGTKAVLLCKCTHPDKLYGSEPGHVFAVGKCKSEGCDCEEFRPETLKTEK